MRQNSILNNCLQFSFGFLGLFEEFGEGLELVEFYLYFFKFDEAGFGEGDEVMVIGEEFLLLECFEIFVDGAGLFCDLW